MTDSTAETSEEIAEIDAAGVVDGRLDTTLLMAETREDTWEAGGVGLLETTDSTAEAIEDTAGNEATDGVAPVGRLTTGGRMVLSLVGKFDVIELIAETSEVTAGFDAAGRLDGKSETILLIAETSDDTCETGVG